MEAYNSHATNFRLLTQLPNFQQLPGSSGKLTIQLPSPYKGKGSYQLEVEPAGSHEGSHRFIE